MTVADRCPALALTAVCLALAGCTAVSPFTEAPPSDGVDPDTARSARALAHFSRATLADMEEDAPTALHHYREAAEAAEDPIEVEHRLLYALIQDDRYDEALDRAEALVEAHPEDAKSRLLVGLIHRAMGNPDEALRSYRNLRRHHPGLALGYIEESSVLLRLDEQDKARDLLRSGLDRTGGDQQLQLLYALAELALRDQAARGDGEPVSPAVADAIPRLEQAREQFPDEDPLLYLLADLYLLNGDLRDALGILLAIEDRDPGNRQVQRKILAGLLNLGDVEAGVSLLQTFAQTADNPEQAEFLIGELYEQIDANDKAIEHYDLLAERYPDNPATYLKLTLLLLEADRTDHANLVINAAIDRIPDEPRFFELRAYLAMTDDRDAEALDDFQRAAEAYDNDRAVPTLPNFRLNYGLAHQHVGNLGDAARQISRAIDENPRAFQRYVSHLWKKRDPDLIASGLEVLEQAGPFRSVFALTQIGLLNKQIERYDAAVDAFDAVMDVANDEGGLENLDEAFYFWYGAANERIRNHDRAEELFLKAIALKPDFADAHNYLAYMHAERGVKLDMAYDHVDLALAVEPDNPAFIDTLGWIYYQRGDYEDALRELQRAVDLLPDDPTILDHLGDAHHKLGNLEDARTAWQTALDHEPDNPDAIQAKLDKSAPPPEPDEDDRVAEKTTVSNDVAATAQAPLKTEEPSPDPGLDTNPAATAP